MLFAPFVLLIVFGAIFNYYMMLRLSKRVAVINGVEFRLWNSGPKMLVNVSISLPFLRPLIIIDKRILRLPESVPCSILAHELAHVARRSSVRQAVVVTTTLLSADIIKATTGSMLYVALVLGIGIVISLVIRRHEEIIADILATRMLSAEKIAEGYGILSAFEDKERTNSLLGIVTRILLGEPTVEDRLMLLLRHDDHEKPANVELIQTLRQACEVFMQCCYAEQKSLFICKE